MHIILFVLKMEEKIKHLEFIQNVIHRLSHKSFLVKSWSITTITAICAFGVDKSNAVIFLIGIPVSLLFWFLDSRYLLLERCYRNLYNLVRKNKKKNFTMEVEDGKDFKQQFKSVFSSTICPIYLLELVLCFSGMLFYSN